MKYDDLSFTTIDENGIEMINDVTTIVPNQNNSDEPYVIFTDYTLDLNDEFVNKYGKLIQSDGHFYIETNLSDMEIAYIKDMSKDEIVSYVNSVVEESLNE
ncbi:MAG: hypothetical protein IKF11_02375 [Methanobrevibacter sp.]|nr:hypothetical protein [Methanobrevibacter sp.]